MGNPKLRKGNQWAHLKLGPRSQLAHTACRQMHGCSRLLRDDRRRFSLGGGGSGLGTNVKREADCKNCVADGGRKCGDFFEGSRIDTCYW